MSELVFELKNVSYAYQHDPALDGLSLNIPRGQRVALLGANGSGKSTLLRLLDALYFPSEGMLSAFGEEVTEASFASEAVNFDFRRKVGFVFQNPDVQLFNATVFDELAFGPLQLGWDKPRILQGVEAMLTRFNIAHLKDRSPYRLSGGEKKRVALASVLILEPDVLLLDEPTAALDPESRSEVVRLLVESRGSGRTIITATHELEMVEDIADHVVVLANGRVAAEGAPAQILDDAELLRRTHLTHSHFHAHTGGVAHEHQHSHRHTHHHAHGAQSHDAAHEGKRYRRL